MTEPALQLKYHLATVQPPQIQIVLKHRAFLFETRYTHKKPRINEKIPNSYHRE